MQQDHGKEAGMTRKFLAAAAVFVGLLALALPAQAKGEGGKLTIGGGGGGAGGGGGTGAALLAKPIHLNGRATEFWFSAGGFGETKYDRPVSMGKPISKQRLGPAL